MYDSLLRLQPGFSILALQAPQNPCEIPKHQKFILPAESIGEAIGIISDGFCLVVVELYTLDSLAVFSIVQKCHVAN